MSGAAIKHIRVISGISVWQHCLRTLSLCLDGTARSARLTSTQAVQKEHNVLRNRQRREGSSSSNSRQVADVEPASLPRIAIVGRPNVGKSTLFNTLTHRRAALVHDTPNSHVTRDYKEGVASLSDLRFVVMDTSGLEPSMSPQTIQGRATGITHQMLKGTNAALFVVDGRIPLCSQDEDVAHWLRANYFKPIVLVCNKIDNPENQLLMAQAFESSRLGLGDPVAISAETKAGLVDLYAALQPIIDKHNASFTSADGHDTASNQAPAGARTSALPRRLRNMDYGGWSAAEVSGSPSSLDQASSTTEEMNFVNCIAQLVASGTNSMGHSNSEDAGGRHAEACETHSMQQQQHVKDSSSHVLASSSATVGAADLNPGPDHAAAEPALCHSTDGSEEVETSSSHHVEGLHVEEDSASEEQQPIKLALMGLPNVGKSTLFNHLLGYTRVLTGPEPGLTRDAITSTFTWGGRAFELTDTAGWIRRGTLDNYDEAGGRVAGLTVLQGTAKMNYAHAVVLLVDGVVARDRLVDSRHAVVQVLSRRELDLAVRVLDEGRILVVAPNKLDELSTEERRAVMGALRAQIETSLGSWSDCISVAPLSAIDGRGVDKVLGTIQALHNKWSTRIPTSALNNWRYKMSLAYAGHGHNPLSSLKYLKMISTRPPTFLAHFRGKVVSKDFPRAVGRQLRESFGLDAVPIRVVPMSKAKRSEQQTKLERARKRLQKPTNNAEEGLSTILPKPRSCRIPNLAS